jgi:hypothetical protein
MNNQLKKTFFNKKTTCLLTGLQDYQFDYFVKQANMIENKLRYSMNDIFYISICNALKDIRLTWVEIKDIYNDSFGSIENFRQNDFFNISVIELSHKEGVMLPSIYLKNDLLEKKIDKSKLPESLKDIDDITDKIFTFKSVFIESNYKHDIYIIYVYKIIDDIINKSKNLNLKVDIENILLSA